MVQVRSKVRPESRLYQDLKKNTPDVLWHRIENMILPGTPDVLGYNMSQHYFTVETKVPKANAIRFETFQVSYHITHPKNSFILIRRRNTETPKLFEGEKVELLNSVGHTKVKHIANTWKKIRKVFDNV